MSGGTHILCVLLFAFIPNLCGAFRLDLNGNSSPCARARL